MVPSAVPAPPGKGETAIVPFLTGAFHAVPINRFAELIDLYQQGRFPVDRLVTTFPFAQINDAAQASASGEVIKAVLTFDNEDTTATS